MTILPESPSVTTDKIHQHVQAGQDREEITSADNKKNLHCPLLVPLQPQGSGTTVIFCPSFRKTAVFYNDLAGQLAPDMTVYSFNWPVPTTDNPPADTLETIAGDFLRDLESCIPHGPYVLGGYCFGAVIAMEMAKRLTASGEKVSLLVLVDPVRPSTGSRWQRWQRRQLNLLRFYRQHGIRFFMRLQYRKGIEMVRDLRFDTTEKWERRFHLAHHRAFHRYQGGASPHRVLLVFSHAERQEDLSERIHHEEDRWKEVLPHRREILILPDCTHHHILSDGAGRIAAKIRAIIVEIDQDG